MAARIKGPGIFLAQFAGDAAPFDSLASIAQWAAGLGYEGVQIPTWDGRLFDLAKAADSQAYCDEVRGVCADAGVAITELSTHLQGQLVAVHPAYDAQFDGFAPAAVHGNPKARQAWAVEQMLMAAKASK
ncbi:MAG: sugar phosphate isomerase/epimerase, partial [Mesorhizobium sp.]